MYTTLPTVGLAVVSGVLSVVVAAVAARQCRSQPRLVRFSIVGTLLAAAVWAGGFAAYLLVDPAYSYHALTVMWGGRFRT